MIILTMQIDDLDEGRFMVKHDINMSPDVTDTERKIVGTAITLLSTGGILSDEAMHDLEPMGEEPEHDDDEPEEDHED